MKKFIYILLVLSLISCGSQNTTSVSTDTPTEISSTKVTLQSILSNMEKGPYKEGELLVRFKSGVSTYASSSIHEALGASVADSFDIVPNLVLVKLPEGMSVSDAIVQYMSDPNVEYAEPNYIRYAFSTIPSDTYFGQQWALDNTGSFAGGSDDADIDAPEAWDITTGSSNITLAVIDSGIDYNHADLVGNIWTNIGETSCTDGVDNDVNGFTDDCIGWDFVNSDNDPIDDYGHGTHVAGTVGAKGNNGEGVSGVMWDVQLMALKVLGATGSGTTADIISAFDYAVANGAKIMNASLGGGAFSQSLLDSIDAANTAEVLLIASAGNSGDNNDLMPMYPASYDLPNIISVAATDQNDIRVPFSNFGPISVDVGAPGVYIFSTVLLGSVISDETYGILDFFAGTSMAAPHVSGLAGLLWSYYDHFDHLQIKETILRYGEPLDSLNGWVSTGKRINAYLALSSLLTPTGLTATFSSSVSLSWTDNATGEDGYKIERSESGGSFTEIDDISADSKTYLDEDPDLVTTKTYTYRVTATNTIPAASHPVQAIVPIAPTALSATVISSSQVDLSWSDNSDNETGFEIWRKTGSGGGSYSKVDTVGADVETYSNTGLSKNTYFYKVRAYAGTSTGYSAFSNEEMAKTGSSDGGGNCSIGARQNTPTTAAGIALMLLPLVFIAILRRRRKYRG